MEFKWIVNPWNFYWGTFEGRSIKRILTLPHTMTSHFVTTKQAPVYVSESCVCAPIMTTWVIGWVFCLWKSEKTSFKICIVISFCMTILPASLLASYLVRSEERRVGEECRSRWSAY